MEVSKTIFRNYDIRGVYPTDLNEKTAYHLGKAFGSYIVRRDMHRVVIGRDDRASSPSLTEQFIKGLIETGCEVTDVGITLTPVIHYLTASDNFDAGVVCTASHNPKEFNGFRFDLSNAVQFYGDHILMLRFMIEREDYVEGDGKLEQKDLTAKYIDFFKKNFKYEKKHKIVIDCGSGASSMIAPPIFEALGCEVVPVYCTYDSNFPHGVPDPENKPFMDELRTHVLQNNAEVGFAYDTDGDRFGVVDEAGNEYETDRIILPFIEDIIKKNPKASVAFDVKSSTLVENIIKKAGGIPKFMRTGHPYFVTEVQRDSIFGAEFSGHTYFSDKYFGYDDGVYASCRVLKLMEAHGQPLSKIMEKYPRRVSTNEIKIDCPDELKFKVVNLIKIHVLNSLRYKKLIDIDGVRVNLTDTGWFLIRASNTTPILSIRAEGENQDELDMLLATIENVLSSIEIYKLSLKR